MTTQRRGAESSPPGGPGREDELPIRRLLFDVAVAAVAIGSGIVVWRGSLTVVYALLLFWTGFFALVDIAIVVQRSARGEPTVLPDDGPALLAGDAPSPTPEADETDR